MKSKPPRKPRMQERGYKALTTFVKEVTYHALRRHAEDLGISHSEYLRKLAEDDLRKKGYLNLIPSPPVAPPSKRPRG
jgi:hypothetical protein